MSTTRSISPDVTARPPAALLRLATGSLFGAIALALVGSAGVGGFAWFQAHGELVLWGCLLPLLWGLQFHALKRFLGRSPAARGARAAVATWASIGAVLVTLGTLLQPSGIFAIAAMLGALALTVAAFLHVVTMLPLLPKRSESVVDTDADPLTKGDDACFTQLRFAQFMLPLGMLLWLATWIPPIANGTVWWPRLHAAGLHLVLAGHALVAVYALAHLWVPRFSGVPAIAAGAIKGELHSLLLGLLGMTAAFLSPPGVRRGLLVAFGPFLFLSFFTFMGVIGANIMRNKSQTHRVTPTFAYVPWTFTAVWWLVAAVLLGLFLAIVPDAMIAYAPGLRFVHVHMALLGGFIQMAIALLLRALPEAAATAPPAFHRHKWPFYAFNIGITVLVADGLGGGDGTVAGVSWRLIGGVLVAIGLLVMARLLATYRPANSVTAAEGDGGDSTA